MTVLGADQAVQAPHAVAPPPRFQEGHFNQEGHFKMPWVALLNVCIRSVALTTYDMPASKRVTGVCIVPGVVNRVELSTVLAQRQKVGKRNSWFAGVFKNAKIVFGSRNKLAHSELRRRK